jgi:hypothetical protein
MFEFITKLFPGTKSPEEVAAEQNLKEAEQLKEAQEKLNTVKTECEKKIKEAEDELKTAQLPVPAQPLHGGRRRKSAKKSNKRRRPAKKSLFNITKKWNPFAK